MTIVLNHFDLFQTCHNTVYNKPLSLLTSFVRKLWLLFIVINFYKLFHRTQSIRHLFSSLRSTKLNRMHSFPIKHGHSYSPDFKVISVYICIYHYPFTYLTKLHYKILSY